MSQTRDWPIYSGRKPCYFWKVIPALIVLYILLLGLAASGSWSAVRLRQRHGFLFLKSFPYFVAAAFAYAIIGFIGEVLAPAILTTPPESPVRVYVLIDLITIPLLAGVFVLFFAWIGRLLGRRFAPPLRAAFWGMEALYLAVFLFLFLSFFVRGRSAASDPGILLLNGILLLLVAAAVLTLLFGAPAGDDPARRQLARGLGRAYAVSFAVLGLVLVLPRTAVSSHPALANAIPAGLMFLVNFPALAYLRRALPSSSIPETPETQAPAGVGKDAGISNREEEIIRLVAQGLGNKEIGERLFIAPKTVKNHMTSIYAKTGARNRVQLTNWLRRRGGESGS